jgi:hypothetical protein
MIDDGLFESQANRSSRMPAYSHSMFNQNEDFTDFSKYFVDSSAFNDFQDTTLDSNLDWIFSNSLDEVFPSVPGSPRLGQTVDNLGNNPTPIQLGREDVHQSRDMFSGHTPNEADDGLSSLPVPTPRDRCDPDDPWPMEWHSTPAQFLVLPSLGEPDDDYSLDPAYYPTMAVNSSIRTRLQESVRLPLERPPWQAVSLANFPSKAKLDHCIDLYFAHFDRVGIFPLRIEASSG